MPAPSTAPVVGIDIGGTATRIGVFPAPTVAPDFTPLIAMATASAYDEELELIAAVLDQVPACGGIGVSLGGRIARDGEAVAVAPNLRDYEGRPFVRDLRTLAQGCRGPVRLAHDPVCGLLAERRYGALAGAERCAYLTVSTGTGAALHLAQGNDAENEAGNHTGDSGLVVSLVVSIEIGHQLLAGNTRECLCGQVGCLETYTGGKQLERRYGRPLTELEDPVIWDELARMLALGLVNLAQLARVEVVAIGGGIALHRPVLIADVRRHVAARLRGMTLELVAAELGERAPLVGAALLPTTPEETILH
jgi:glucokinase